MRAWLAGDYDRCLDLCDHVERRRPTLSRDVALLRARTLLRLDRPRDVLAELDRLPAAAVVDASITRRMLAGAARVRLGEIDEGLALLDVAEADAIAGGAHPTIRAEIALYRGLGYYGHRDLARADEALSSVSATTDLIFALALSYRGWVATARADYSSATDLFRQSLHVLDKCRHYEVALEANVLQALTHLAVERLDQAAWAIIEERFPKLVGSPATDMARFWVYMARCYMAEIAGERRDAVAAARAAEDEAPTDGYRVHAHLRHAAIARYIGEPVHQYDNVKVAQSLFVRLDPDTLQGDERTVALTLAEELALIGDVEAARWAYSLYQANRPTSPMLAMSDDPRARAYERHVEAQIADAAGLLVEAHHGYRDAFRMFREIGFRRRALLAAFRLAEIEPSQGYLFTYIAGEIESLSPLCWFRRAIARTTLLLHDPTYQRLAPHEREVLVLVCRGLTTREIAEARKNNEKHIRNVISAVFRAFDVSRRAQLLAACSRRGILEALIDESASDGIAPQQRVRDDRGSSDHLAPVDVGIASARARRSPRSWQMSG